MKPLHIVDLHCDTLMPIYIDGHTLRNWTGHINLEKLQQGGSMVQCFAIFIPTNRSAEYHHVHEEPYAYFRGCADAFDREMAANADVIRPVRCMADIEKNRQEGKLSAMLTVEDGVPVDGKIQRVQEFYDRGVRMVALTWNYENSIGFPCSDDPEKHMLGLKPFGLEVVSKMDELGMVIDTSHLSEGGFWDIVKHGKKPFVASHSCARALCDHRRNLTDEQLKIIFESGGVVGLNLYDAFLGERLSGYDDLLRHVDNMYKAGGEGNVALGSDFDGCDTDERFNNVSDMPRFYDYIAAHLSRNDADGIFYGNAARFFEGIV